MSDGRGATANTALSIAREMLAGTVAHPRGKIVLQINA